MQDLDIYNSSYLIIGGPNTKKSEVSRYLSKYLNYKLINLDREKHSFFNDFTNYDEEKYYKLIETKGKLNALNYIHKYEMKHLNYVIDNIDTNVIIDFGNTYLIIDDINIINKLKLFNNIVLLKTNNVSNDELVNKLNRNKLLNDLSNIKINIDNKSVEDIVKELLNYKEFNSLL